MSLPISNKNDASGPDSSPHRPREPARAQLVDGGAARRQALLAAPHLVKMLLLRDLTLHVRRSRDSLPAYPIVGPARGQSTA